MRGPRGWRRHGMSASAAGMAAGVDDSLAQGLLEDHLGEVIETMPASPRPAATQILSENQAAGTDALGGISVGLSPNGRLLVTDNQSGIGLWDVALCVGTGVGRWSGFLWDRFRKLRTEVCSLAGCNLTRSEWRQAAPGIPYQEPCG